MARDVMDTELGYAISALNGDRQVYLISGTNAPDGTSGKQQEAPIGSLYIRSGSGELYQKIANAGAPADYQLNSATGVSLGNWRPERVDAHTGQVLVAGITDPTGWSDNDGGFDGTGATVGHYILDGNCALWEITAVGGASSITLAAAATPPAADDMFAVKHNLPDPIGQENQAIIVYDGTSCIKVADVDFANASGITVDAGYTPGSGDPVGGESVLVSLQKLDGNNDAQDSVLGTAQGDTNLGTFTGDIISDNGSVKSGMQELETELVDTRDNVDDLITLSGVAENSTNFGAFAAPGSFLLTATETMKSALQKLSDYLFGVKVTQTTGVQAATVVDSLPHATYGRVKWVVEVFETATPANAEGFTVDALTDGTTVDDTVFGKLNINKITGLSVNVAINGANLELSISATASCTVNVRRITVV